MSSVPSSSSFTLTTSSSSSLPFTQPELDRFLTGMELDTGLRSPAGVYTLAGHTFGNVRVVESVNEDADVMPLDANYLWHVTCLCRKIEGTLTNTQLQEVRQSVGDNPDVCACGKVLRKTIRTLRPLVIAQPESATVDPVYKIPYEKAFIPPDLRWAVWERDNFTCLECGIRRNLSIDHIKAESKGGPTVMENLRTLCMSCNRRKGAK